MFFKKEYVLNEAEQTYLKDLTSCGLFLNTAETALPQTVVGNLVKTHFESKNGKHKKALIMGFDGARADAMQLCFAGDNPSAVRDLSKAGGLYLSFAGGEKGHLQGTATQQGWAAILTGKWGYQNGVVHHTPIKKHVPTVLRSLAEQGTPSAFLAQWGEHFKVTYRREMKMAEKNHLPLTFTKTDSDEKLYHLFLDHINGDTDCIFGIFEAPDLNGHGSGFSNENPKYKNGILENDRYAKDLIEAVKARPTFAQEDWLLLITSDHGGHDTGHGTQSPYDRMTFIASNKPIK